MGLKKFGLGGRGEGKMRVVGEWRLVCAASYVRENLENGNHIAV